ncbi:MAG: cytochrome-c oxidase, cbb3-type subunit III [Gammaproteobacteria bacterium]|nr:cytochrome-c oxidase, cbb3-type subunit III [Gammaproteobacteria bacterium]
MSAFWSSFIIVLTVINILACVWLIVWTSKRRPDEVAEGDMTDHVWDEDLREYNNPLPRWWLFLFLITIVFSLIYLVLYPGYGNYAGVLQWTQLQQYEQESEQIDARQAAAFAPFLDLSIPALSGNQEALAIGQRIFANNCSTCHGSDGRGARGFPNLSDNDWLYGGTPEAITTSIINGRNGIMPPFAPGLGEQGVAESAAYVFTMNGRDPLPGMESMLGAGKQHFDVQCAICHGAEGKGNYVFGAPNLTDDIWLHGGDFESIKQTVAQGRSDYMPAHRGLLSEAKIKLVAAYVYSLSQTSKDDE